MATTIIFQPTVSPTANPLDLWQIEADLLIQGESLAAGGEEGAAVWSISLPGEASQARQSLAQRLETVAHRQQAIGAAGQYLQAITPLAAKLAFGIDQADVLTQEKDLLLTTLANATAPTPAESFDFAGLARWRTPIAGWDDTLKAYSQFMAQAVELLKPALRIETTIEARLLAQTLVRASGALEIIWRQQVTPQQMALHRQTVQLTLETRQSLAFFLAQVSAGAASLAGKFTVAQWVALPAAFRFMQDVVRRAREDQLLARLETLRER